MYRFCPIFTSFQNMETGQERINNRNNFREYKGKICKQLLQLRNANPPMGQLTLFRFIYAPAIGTLVLKLLYL
ncbi:unnamed protein product [Allacma fusca]|uniref:Uncharacterized protein n=1 Tax=Allacma fusca TaxID=39272 RepID=A0A8J2JK58_9HEXA|nr:unnamed protein product [Allacma fusca]